MATGNSTIAGTPAIALSHVSKHFGDVVAVDDIELDIRPGEFFALLGPSGSGKTTLLRMIAGFEMPTSGTIRLDGADVTRLPPFERDVNTVFQDYALFPHMSVARNVEYGLRVKKVARAERAERVDAALAAVRLSGFGDRKPSQLSGGQRQRVALARALINRPRVLLLDEPLGALDLKLREEMQVELKEIQRNAGITFVFVTHDQGEALAMSDRIAVFDHGRIEQVGTPEEMYDRPTSEFVARFVGTSNILTAEVVARLLGPEAGATAHGVRPERAALVSPGAAPTVDLLVLDGEVHDLQYLGSVTRVRCLLDDGSYFVVDRPSQEANMPGGPGARVSIVVPRAAVYPIGRPTTVPVSEGAP